MDDYVEIKPCPFCGGEARLYRNGSTRGWTTYYYIRVQCDMCGSQGKTIRSETDPSEHDWSTTECMLAIRAWNTRAKTE